ncbi:MAG: hypothetical protein NVS2B12_41210 [Ktedonobacteraceae bacterium]
MLNFKRSVLVIVGLLCALAITACGGSVKATNEVGSQGNASANTTVQTTPTIAPTAQAQMTAVPTKMAVQNQPAAQGAINMPKNVQNNVPATGNQNMQNAVPNAGGSGTLVASTQVNVNGQMTIVLTNGNGMSLYYRSDDPAPGSICTGACATAWPPFLAQGNVIPADNFQGVLTVHATANGNQVEYNGHPLYTYSGDKSRGQLNGQGLNGVWNAVTVLPAKQHW